MSMIKGGGKNLAVSVVVTLGVTAAAILFLNACAARHDERATADNSANTNSSPAARPSDTQTVTPAMSPTPTNAEPNPSREKTVVEKPTLVSPDSQGQQNLQAQQNSNAQSTPAQTLTGPGTGVGSGMGPGNGGGSGINPYPRHGNPADIDYNRVFSSREVDQRARILEKPEPVYTVAARNNDVTGTVVLSVVFTASGQVVDIKVIHGLPDGLNETAIAAARRIKFTPALIYGRPVSMYMQLEYNFNLY